MNLKSINSNESLIIYKDSEIVKTEEEAKELLKIFIDKENNLDTLLQMLQTCIEDNGHYDYVDDDIEIASVKL